MRGREFWIRIPMHDNKSLHVPPSLFGKVRRSLSLDTRQRSGRNYDPGHRVRDDSIPETGRKWAWISG